jgi:hypothetical protein
MRRVVWTIDRHDNLKALYMLEEAAYQLVELSGKGGFNLRLARFLSKIRQKFQAVQLGHSRPQKRSSATAFRRTLLKFEQFAKEAITAMQAHDKVQLAVTIADD